MPRTTGRTPSEDSELKAPVDALLELADAIGDRAPPCFADPDGWFRGDPTEALAGCDQCHAEQECAVYATSVHADAGVWGGKSFDRGRLRAE